MKLIDLSSIDLNLLVTFEVLFEERSVTVAAQRLYLGQPAMSAALARLRILFQDELFIRIGREMQPTAKALEIAPGISVALQQIRQTLESSQTFDPKTSKHTFAIGSSDYTSYVVLPKLLEVCRQVAPSIDFRLIGFEKDSVGDLLEQREIHVALGLFQNPPRQTRQMPLFEEHFVGLCRRGHPVVTQENMTPETFACLPQALFTLRRDDIGEIDKVLAQYNLQRRVVLTTPHLLILPTVISSSDLVTVIPSRLVTPFAYKDTLEIFELPVKTEPWMISMLWSKLTDQDQASIWLRQMLKSVCEGI
ncbi:transcriptional regulator, LysR family [Trichormus variabilis ATCC 29413]|uniref:Transcriptional regulator, LysR family n=3 Tax=Anabaena variabilis TaxID=264691 RepID=Q3M9C1_TRIV2|nr:MULTISPECIES: LysR family transcriptional regulator [Nostocaceae]ABA22415.1 transcriptional regulator, LysR family [Trichormus variabilis ATCC 29413]MBC1214940.1 LysR family transcriptional regulator [Trichormus variabilis ARAD]MBC1268552.1 LysR family transcriptional regulator [Trichormus variabilis FSR]MBC1304323.1 LysR family transcriptional regulator [Trichormus variabilis N2B]MBC1313308.1 LysR family transcriptional regulator [Trichormus variabilis PNB]